MWHNSRADEGPSSLENDMNGTQIISPIRLTNKLKPLYQRKSATQALLKLELWDAVFFSRSCTIKIFYLREQRIIITRPGRWRSQNTLATIADDVHT